MGAKTKFLTYSGVIALLLSGCSATETAATISEQPSQSETSVSAELAPEVDDSYVGTWLRAEPVSAQKILEDLTYVGFCDNWADAPSPESAYGQAYARDFLRECSSYGLPQTTPDCSVGLTIGTGVEAQQIPTEMRFEDSSYVAIFSHPKFSITFTTGGEHDPDVMAHRCYGALKAMDQLLEGKVELQLIGNRSLITPLNQILEMMDYWDNVSDYVEIGDRVWMRWTDGLDTCPSGWYYCAELSLVTAGWCADLSLEYQLLDAEEKQVGETKYKSLTSESSFEPFLAVVGSKQSDPEFEYFSQPVAACNAWLE